MGFIASQTLASPSPSVAWQSPGAGRQLMALSADCDRITTQGLIDSMPAEVAIVDRDWNILLANRAWELAADRAACEALQRGGNYRAVCISSPDQPGTMGRSLLDALDDLAAGRRARFWHACADPAGGHKATYRVCISRIDFGTSAFATITRYETTELVRLRHQCETLGGSVLHIQDGERRRIGRELHDSTSQLLVALQLDLMRLKQGKIASDHAIFDDISATIAQIHIEIRATSYLFHPPMNAEQPLEDAVGELIAGFGKRTGLKMRLACDLGRAPLGSAARAAVFRITQEALANVHRHATAGAVEIRLSQRRRHLHLVIRDDGIGVPEYFYRRRGTRVALGVGIAGMEERVAQLGGRLAFRRVKSGTCLTVSLPIDSR